MNSGRGRGGFTLIELLVVIAIISILAGILFPVFSKVREKARQATCESNLRQIALAIQMYADDYDGTCPLLSYDSHATATPMVYWFQAIYPYIQNTQLFTCPSNFSASGTMPLDRYVGDGIWTPDSLRNSYAFNNQLSGVSLDRVNSPSNLFMNWDASTSSVSTDDSPETKNRYRTDVPVHSGGDNYAFVDGHVKWFDRDATPYNDPKFILQ